MTQWFDRFARICAHAIGSAYAFVAMCGLTLLWLALGPLVGWSAVWQITLTTALTVATQLTAMLIQNDQNRNEAAIQKKLDSIVLALEHADNRVIGMEHKDKRDIDTTNE